jgi:purine-binding chemotaxis protein CheW
MKKAGGKTMSGIEAYDIGRILQEMRDEYWRGIEEVDGRNETETKEFLVFRLGGERYAIKTRVAREDLRLPRLERVPRVGDHNRGVIN